ncbi:MAG TPA: cupin domain-containing protein [Thermoanaerobaculia bacterium]|jgi:predicted cupin superfamily sugar epimerase|nr:cupin domain-containing protein [Thermoanaerobaculia bacterium]
MKKAAERTAELVASLGLIPHPEGGWFAESYRAAERIRAQHLPARFGGGRPFSTAIYFLLKSGHPSHLHRLHADELWHFHEGSPIAIHVLDTAGQHRTIRLGAAISEGETFQACIPAGCWFGAEVVAPDSYALVGCTVAPGFDFADFEMGERGELLAQYPEHRELIDRLAR